MIEALHAGLVQTGAFALVRLDGAEERRWLDCDLASLAENRLGDLTDPRQLDEQRRADWIARAADERPWPLHVRGEYERCYWILEHGEPAGTIALAPPRPGSQWLRVSSFYLFPIEARWRAESQELDAALTAQTPAETDPKDASGTNVG